MEGSRHERAVLVILSYVIGFVTAFIAFVIGSTGVTQLHSTYVADYADNSYDYKKYAQENATANESVDATEVTVKTAVEYQDGKLRIERETTSYLLSVNLSVLGMSRDALAIDKQGWHFSKPAYQLAPDGSQLFFCEQQDESATTCSTFIFDLDANVIRPITVDGKPLALEITDAEDAQWYGDRLAVANYLSADETEPWNLTTAR